MTQQQLMEFAENPKRFFKQYVRARNSIGVKQARIEYWRQYAEDVSVTLRQDGGISGGGAKSSRVEIAVTNIVDLQNKIRQILALRKSLDKLIETYIDDKECRMIIRLRHFGGEPWWYVAEYLGLSKRWVQRLEEKSLQRLSQAIYKCVLPGV